MKAYLQFIVVLTILSMAEILVFADSENEVQQQVPDEYIIEAEQLTFKGALDALGIIDSSLHSFRALTNLIDFKTNFMSDANRMLMQKKSTEDIVYTINIKLDELRKIGNLGWAFQNIGFHNRTIHIHGLLLKQNAEIKRLEYELLKAQKANQEKITEAKHEMELSQKEFKEYINSHTWTD